jgi:chromosome segregation ATPase
MKTSIRTELRVYLSTLYWRCLRTNGDDSILIMVGVEEAVMQRKWRRALWGYRIVAVNQAVDALETQLAQRHEERTGELSRLKSALAERQAQVQDAEDVLRQFQADYFTLSGQLNAILNMPQQRLEEARAALENAEAQAHLELESRRRYVEHLANTVRSMPQHLSTVIETITAAIQGGPTSLNPSSDPAPRPPATVAEDLPSASGHD